MDSILGISMISFTEARKDLPDIDRVAVYKREDYSPEEIIRKLREEDLDDSPDIVVTTKEAFWHVFGDIFKSSSKGDG